MKSPNFVKGYTVRYCTALLIFFSTSLHFFGDDGWKLGQGPVEKLNHSGSEILCAKGNGNDCSFWKNDKLKLDSKKLYAVHFKTRSEGSGGCAITGTNSVNRDFYPTNFWKDYSFIFSTPDNAENTYLRFGQWHWNGKVFFDDIHIFNVLPAHLKSDPLELGENEQIKNGIYTFTSRFDDYSSNYSRVLHYNSADFNSNRWVFSHGSEIIYKHNLPMKQISVSVRVNVNHYDSGQVAVSAECNSQTVQLGILDKIGIFSFDLPPPLLSANTVFVKFKSNNGGLQINSYEYSAELDKNTPDITEKQCIGR